MLSIPVAKGTECGRRAPSVRPRVAPGRCVLIAQPALGARYARNLLSAHKSALRARLICM